MSEHKILGTREIHQQFLAEFVKWERAGGGPDPHVKLANWIAKNDPRVVDRLWWFGCYITPYVVSTGEVIFDAWRSAEAVLADQDGFRGWLEMNYPKFEIRKERRAIYGTKRFGNTLIEYAKWCQQPMVNDSFEAAWAHCSKVPGFGRYACTKLYEVLYRDGILVHPFPDIRPDGADTPRLMLSWLRPGDAAVLNGGNRPATLTQVNQISAEEREWFRDHKGLDMDWFEWEVVLCEYHQAYKGGQYPGRSHDSELGRAMKVQANYPNLPLKIWEARKAMFPHLVLGEVGGRWAGRRGLGCTVPSYHYTWSDLVYDFNATTDLANPVRRPDAPAN